MLGIKATVFPKRNLDEKRNAPEVCTYKEISNHARLEAKGRHLLKSVAWNSLGFCLTRETLLTISASGHRRLTLVNNL